MLLIKRHRRNIFIFTDLIRWELGVAAVTLEGDTLISVIRPPTSDPKTTSCLRMRISCHNGPYGWKFVPPAINTEIVNANFNLNLFSRKFNSLNSTPMRQKSKKRSQRLYFRMRFGSIQELMGSMRLTVDVFVRDYQCCLVKWRGYQSRTRGPYTWTSQLSHLTYLN